MTTAHILPKTFDTPVDGARNRGWALLAVCAGMVTCATISTLLRILIRSRLTKNLGWDDYTMIAANLLTIVGLGLICGEVINGLGQHEYYLTPKQISQLHFLAWLDWLQVFLTLMLTKVSICLFLLRILIDKWLARAMYALITCLVVFTLICDFLFLGICRPIQGYWRPEVQASCFTMGQVEHIVLAQGILSVIGDLICAMFPILILRTLQISFRVKVGLCILMGLGVITAACCTVRTTLVYELLSPDLAWETVDNVGWRLPEINIGILCANAPVMRPAYLYLRGRLHTTHRASSAGVQPWTPSKRPSEAARREKPRGQVANNETGETMDGDVGLAEELGLPIQRYDSETAINRDTNERMRDAEFGIVKHQVGNDEWPMKRQQPYGSLDSTTPSRPEERWVEHSNID